MKRLLAISAALAALSACGGGGEAENASASGAGETEKAGQPRSSNPGATAAAAAETIQPGLWEVTTQMLALSIPGMPPEASAQAQEPETSRECITPEEAREMSQAFLEEEEGRTCSEREFTMRGGRLNGRMTCTQDGQQSTVSIQGEYSDTTYDITMEMSSQVPGAEQPMSMRFRGQGRRVGECPAGMEEEEGSAEAPMDGATAQ